MKRFSGISFICGAMLLFQLQPAFAHINPADQSSFASGFVHPLSGADHVLVMVAVGLWAVQLGGRAPWAVPLSFVIAMTGGFVLALSGIALPFVESAILASVVAIGLFAAMALRLPTGFAMGIVAVFALFHGHAHGSEFSGTVAAAYGTGFAMATLLLHGVGIAVGLGAGFASGPQGRIRATRAGGALTVLASFYLAFAV